MIQTRSKTELLSAWQALRRRKLRRRKHARGSWRRQLPVSRRLVNPQWQLLPSRSLRRLPLRLDRGGAKSLGGLCLRNQEAAARVQMLRNRLAAQQLATGRKTGKARKEGDERGQRREREESEEREEKEESRWRNGTEA